jgi:hypothetical protein
MKVSVACMTGLAQALLAGAALSVLAAAPSSAQAPDAPQLTLHSGAYHSKSNMGDPKNAETYTSTATFTGTFSESELYGKWTELWALTAPDCNHVKLKFPKSTPAAKIKVIEMGGDDELFYKLESKKAASDSFSGEIEGHGCGKHTNLNLIINTDLTISH